MILTDAPEVRKIMINFPDKQTSFELFGAKNAQYPSHSLNLKQYGQF
jgi:hypothetical protein